VVVALSFGHVYYDFIKRVPLYFNYRMLLCFNWLKWSSSPIFIRWVNRKQVKSCYCLLHQVAVMMPWNFFVYDG